MTKDHPQSACFSFWGMQNLAEDCRFRRILWLQLPPPPPFATPRCGACSWQASAARGVAKGVLSKRVQECVEALRCHSSLTSSWAPTTVSTSDIRPASAFQPPRSSHGRRESGSPPLVFWRCLGAVPGLPPDWLCCAMAGKGVLVGDSCRCRGGPRPSLPVLVGTGARFGLEGTIDSVRRICLIRTE